MSINDSFVVMPVLPILILINFILRKSEPDFLEYHYGLLWLGLDARLIRSQVLSLKEREFTYSGLFREWGCSISHSANIYPL